MKIASLLKIVLASVLVLSLGIIACLTLLVNGMIGRGEAFDRQLEYQQLAAELESASDYLTNEVRNHVQFGEQEHLDNYWKEVNETKTRDRVVTRLKELGAPEELLSLVEEAKKKSDTLIQLEDAAMRAVEEEDFDKARELVFGKEYEEGKAQILVPIDKFQKDLADWAHAQTEETSIAMKNYLIMTSVSMVLLMLVILSSLLLFMRKISPLKEMTAIAESVSGGNLAAGKVKADTKDEVGVLGRSFNTMVDNLRTLIQEIGQTSEQVAASAEELSASAEQSSTAAEAITSVTQELASGSEKQLNAVSESSGYQDQMAENAIQIASRADLVSASARTASDKALEGNESIVTSIQQMESIQENVAELADVIKELGSRSHEIGKIVDVITGIADQTNLLALNAAIEAARAGEQGKGFAVVADEVRKLAEQSASSANQISNLIKLIRQSTSLAVSGMNTTTREVSEGITVVNKAGESFKGIIQSTEGVADEMEAMSGTVKDLVKSMEKVADAAKAISLVAEQTLEGAQMNAASSEEQLASMEEITSSSTMLAAMAEAMQTAVAKFKM
ncbi:methyl-accepting chemotaxis protein [Metabacillus sp. 113a]|uniref:methyl-accepting chemotaxis protein n=1 Tax=Metabacillus sp. 113a TaxID=3404706 RepID=UPI003CED570A